MGKLAVGGLVLDTMERPWIPDPAGGLGGHPDLSCVPVGVYHLVLHDSLKHPKTWALVNESLDVYELPTAGKRSECLLNPANWAWELLGCCAPGLARVKDGTTWMVTNSDTAMARLQAIVPWVNGHMLIIS
jgi:hypothetical protein